jgi:hypothetical protein
MSEESDREDSVVSDDAGVSLGEDSDESGTEDGNDFLDLEAEESGESDEDDDSNLDSNALEHSSFPQFSSLPAELRSMIWEAVDPYLKIKGRVMEFRVVDDVGQLWETATVEPLTAPARTLLATSHESRIVALKHYPDVIQLRCGRGHVRFNSDYDIILLRGTYFGAPLPGVARWCSKVQHLAYNVDNWPIDPASLEGFENLKRVFVCVDGSLIKKSEFEKTIVPNPLNLFWLELMEEETSVGEDMWDLFCWPDKTSRANFAEIISDGDRQLNSMPSEIGSVPLWTMVRFSFGAAINAYEKLGYTASNPPPTGPPPGEGWSDWRESESETETEPDEYELDGFVVNSSPEGSEGSSDDGGNDFDGDPGDADDGEPQASPLASHEDLESFHGFSPLQEDPNDFDTGEQLPVAATFSSLEPESPQDHISVASSSEEEPITAKQTSRFKRRVLSSDDEDGGEGGANPDVESHSRPKKRARVVLSDSEDEDEDEHNDTRKNHPRDNQLDKDDEDDDNEDDDTEEGDEEEDDTEEDEAEPRASKPVSLLARLRQFRSDVPVSPEGDSPNSTGDEYGREDRYERDDDDEDEDGDGEGAFLDAEYPDSADEDVEDDRW